MSQRPVLLCTVGTSLFQSNLAKLEGNLAADALADELQALARAYQARDWDAVADALAVLPGNTRICGAEVNSLHSLIANRHVRADCALYFFHSATPDGRDIAAVLRRYFHGRGHRPVEAIEVDDLQDSDPRRFRTHGLRQLARKLCRVIRDHGPGACAINATGGYKAQIAVAVLIGQALGVPVYYMHERFSEIIAFPPLPVALDFEMWMRASGMLFALDREGLVSANQFAEGWEEAFESLVERERVDGIEHLALSATGQVFHESFRDRFRSQRDQVLPSPAVAGRKQRPVLKSDEGHMLQHRDTIERFLGKLIAEVPQVIGCTTRYFNPDLPGRTSFRLTRGEVEGILSEGGWTVKFRVDTTATTEGQRAAMVAALNDWLQEG